MATCKKQRKNERREERQHEVSINVRSVKVASYAGRCMPFFSFSAVKMSDLRLALALFVARFNSSSTPVGVKKNVQLFAHFCPKHEALTDPLQDDLMFHRICRRKPWQF